MSKELTFDRPGRVQISVSMSAGNRLYFVIRQIAYKRCKHLVTMFSVRPDACELVESKGRWSLDTGDVSFHFEPDEARRLAEAFGIEVRHVNVSSRSKPTDAAGDSPC